MAATPYLNYIAGQWRDGRGGAHFLSINPATEAPVGMVAAAEAGDVDAAVQAAQAAFEGWRLTPAPRRGEILQRVGERLREDKEALARLLT